MNASSPYVVLLTTISGGVGQSTLASNLAVYLKGMLEDLPVAYISSDAPSAAAMFALPGSQPGNLSDLDAANGLAAVLAFGEYGVEFCTVGNTVDKEPSWLRKQLYQSNFPGILILDVEKADPLLPAALWAADLVLAPIKDPAVLGELVGLRREYISGGGQVDQFWLVPSELGGTSRYQTDGESLDVFLRFAAEERNFQLFDENFVSDLGVHEKAAAKAKPVLTRLPQSLLHQYFCRLAELVLEQRQQHSSFACRVRRWQADGELPERAARVPLFCPLCRQPVLGEQVLYLEAFPARRRLLLHQRCVGRLLGGTGTVDFLTTLELLLVRPGVARGGHPGELFLQALSPGLELLNSEPIALDEPWRLLLREATGRQSAELYQDALLLSAALPAEEALTSAWYRQFVRLRRRLRAACVEEII